jgi:hypothetical protein
MKNLNTPEVITLDTGELQEVQGGLVCTLPLLVVKVVELITSGKLK